MQLDQKALIEEAVQASIDAGLAVDGEHGVAAARHAARFMFNALQAVQPVPVADEGTYEEGYDEGLRDAQGHAVEVTQAVARWLDNHLGAGNWYDQAEDGFTADDVIQGLFETVRDPNAAPLPAQRDKADE